MSMAKISASNADPIPSTWLLFISVSPRKKWPALKSPAMNGLKGLPPIVYIVSLCLKVTFLGECFSLTIFNFENFIATIDGRDHLITTKIHFQCTQSSNVGPADRLNGDWQLVTLFCETRWIWESETAQCLIGTSSHRQFFSFFDRRSKNCFWFFE